MVTKRPSILALLFIACAVVSTALGQDASQWNNYVDSENEIWFQVPGQVLIDRDKDRNSVKLHAFFDGVMISVRRENIKSDPIKTVKQLGLPWAFRGSIVREYKAPGFLVRQEIEANGEDLNITAWVGTKKSYFELTISGSPQNAAARRFVDTLRIGGRRFIEASTAVDMPVTGVPIVFDKLAASAEIEAALKTTPAGPESLGTLGIVSKMLPLELDKLSRNLIILRKPRPRPGYTDNARVRNIQGDIPVNVEFLANGQIGNILVDERLDRGLARNVLGAVRNVKFLPAQANGKPVDVTRTLTYGFRIY